jgi:hypothetical protein
VINVARQAHPDKHVTLSFQDEARVGQKGRACHRWWTRGQRPPGLCDQRYTWVHLFVAVRPATGDRVALVMPAVSTEAIVSGALSPRLELIDAATRPRGNLS